MNTKFYTDIDLFFKLAEPQFDNESFIESLDRDMSLFEDESQEESEFDISEKVQKLVSFIRKYRPISFNLLQGRNGFQAEIDLTTDDDNFTRIQTFNGSMRDILMKSYMFLQEKAQEL